MAVESEHGHTVVPATVDPAAASIRSPACSAVSPLTSRLVTPGKIDFPGKPRTVFGGAGGCFAVLTPTLRVMIFVAIFFVHLGYDPARFGLLLAIAHHESP